MALALVFNPGSNSLKFELIEFSDDQQIASEAVKLASAALDGIGNQTKLSAYEGRTVIAEQNTEAPDMTAAVRVALTWLQNQQEVAGKLKEINFVGVRVVHGGSLFSGATRVDGDVRRGIESLEELAPLHNQSSLDILDVLSKELGGTPVFVTFDTAFHRTLPEKAWRYPIERETADRHGVRKFGFHGLSHRYMLEQYAHVLGKRKEELCLVTLHLESGSSACAISQGVSVDTTMGLTPLEGLMMGSRSGSIDPAILPYLMEKEKLSAPEVLSLLNKRSGMLGIAGGTLDTRELVKRNDEAATLALAMFSYRVRLAVGAYLAALGDVEAVLFGGGIGEDSPWLREEVCNGLQGWGLELNRQINEQSIAGMARITRENSRLQAWAMPVEEGLQIARECWMALQNEK